MHHHHRLEELALLGVLALGAYELYHLERYGNFGFGNPNHHGISFGTPFANNNPSVGYHHGHHHHHHFFQ